MTFQRARSEEQREIRRSVILNTTTTMLGEMPVADVSLNEISRRVGLAKSNVLRYFESREAVLLQLLDDYFGKWLPELDDRLQTGVDERADLPTRAHQLADVLSRSLADQSTMLDLFGAQGGVLEHNVSTEVVRRYKRSSLGRLATMTELVTRRVPELGEDAQFFCFMTLITAGALAAYVPPPASLLAVYADEPELSVLNLNLRQALQGSITSTLLGALPRP
ncbi:TetR/AcrR family transcriptional regulator [Curtobacterium sp. MCSS17_006]|uniref:TetR/AcrR family transcriptional regulator n=1 Tax=Curtobacterium TaxID=2034 RepID=UPI000DA9166B|nr:MULTISPECIES: TetR family transcriptional regulator [Curtobacterium]MBT1673437.1 TetR/AcrR family transcriptional regulator [Curtobacterium flaccumfaciens pv. flaccumfaciens]PZE40761.1 TetR/AcrR family transcriptional regulator [Curtobacterium sp. MCSS17_006]